MTLKYKTPCINSITESQNHNGWKTPLGSCSPTINQSPPHSLKHSQIMHPTWGMKAEGRKAAQRHLSSHIISVRHLQWDLWFVHNTPLICLKYEYRGVSHVDKHQKSSHSYLEGSTRSGCRIRAESPELRVLQASKAQGAPRSEQRAEAFQNSTEANISITCIAVGQKNPSCGSGPCLRTELILGTNLYSC